MSAKRNLSYVSSNESNEVINSKRQIINNDPFKSVNTNTHEQQKYGKKAIIFRSANEIQEKITNTSFSKKKPINENTDKVSSSTADTCDHLLGASRRNKRQGPPLEYVKFGKCDQLCEYCGAKFWIEEKLVNSSKSTRPSYHKCCLGGTVVLHQQHEYPEYIKQLYQNHHFMENIRAYNQMFSMTSFGARIDNSINKGSGPYVFKVSGQIYHNIGSMCPEEGERPRFLQLYIYDTDNEVTNRMFHFGGEETSGLKREIVENLIEVLDNHNALVQLFRIARNKMMDATIPELKVKLYNVIGTRRYELPTAESIGANHPWYYKRCSECTRKVIGDFPMARCIDHGPQPIPNYSYCFKAKIDDGTGQITLTCFSPESNGMVIECNNVLAQLEDKNTKQLPLSLTSLQGTQHIFQFHFSKESQLGHASFILDKVLDPKPLAILQPDTEISETSTLNIKTSKSTEDMTESTSKVSTPATEYQIVAPEKETETSNPGKKPAAKRQLSFQTTPQKTSNITIKKGKQE